MRKPDKSAIMSIPVGPEISTKPVQSGAGDSISDLASRLAGAGKRLDAASQAEEAPREVQMPFMSAAKSQVAISRPTAVLGVPDVPVVSKKGQMSLTGDVVILNNLKSLSKSEKLTNAEMVGEMLLVYTKLKELGRAQRYSAAEMLDVLLSKS